MKIRPIVKLIIILLIFAAGYGVYWFADKKGMIDKILPKGKTEAVTKEAKQAIDKGVPHLVVAINTWGGYAPGLYYNNGLAGSTNSRFYTEQNIIVEFKLMEEFKSMRDSWKADQVHIMGLATVDSLPPEIESINEYKPKVPIQVDWSRGGDVVVGARGINTPRDIIGKKVAFALGTPSHSLLLTWLQAGNVSYSDIQPKTTDSGIQAAQMFKTGNADVAVVWSPDDQDCIKAIPGSKVIFDTRKATHVIADVFVVKDAYLQKNREAVKAFIKGWLIAVAEINTNKQAKEEAARIMVRSFNGVDINLARLMISNARLSTYGDNLQFFGLAPGGVKAEEVYVKMARLFASFNLSSPNIPSWRSIVDTSLLAELNIVGPGHEAEGTIKFAPPTETDVKAPAFAEKPVTVNFAFNSDRLTDDGKIDIDTYFSNTAKEFGNTRVRIEGNTDSIGSRSYNKKLSHVRARAVASYLSIKYGFDPNKFVIVGNGSDNPVPGCEDNATDACRAKNRRTDFFLLR